MRKLSHKDNNSDHSYNNKIAAFNRYLHRLLNVSLNNDDYNSEVNWIKQVAINSG